MLALNKIKLRAIIYFSAFNEKTPSVVTSHMLAVNAIINSDFAVFPKEKIFI